jgi:iron(III) transport system substrate-binding protein
LRLSGQPPSTSAAQVQASGADALFQAAKKEGTLVVNTHDPDNERIAAAAFNKRYPGIKIDWQVGRGADIGQKIITQAQGNVYNIDVFEAGPHDMGTVQQAGLLEAYQAPELAGVRPEFLDQSKTTDPVYVLVYGLTVNTKLVPPGSEPHSWTDLLDPRWKGKIAMQDPRGSGGTTTLMLGLTHESSLGDNYVRRLGQQDVFISRATEQLLTDLIRGEHDVLLAASAASLVLAKAKDPSVPIKEIKPSEGVATTLLSMAVVKNAPHPNAARLWIDWRLSQEGQEAIAQQGNAPVRQGVKVPNEETSLDGVKVLYVDTGQDLAKIKDYSKTWDEVFFKKS